MNTTGCGPRGGQAVERRADRERARRRRARPGRRRRRPGRSVAAVVRRAATTTPPSRSMRTCSTGWPSLGQGLGDGGPGHDRDVVLGRRAAEQDDDRRPVARRSPLTARPPSRTSRRRTRSRSARSTPCAGQDLGADALGEAADVGGGPLLVVDDEVGVLLGHDRAADPRALEPGRLDQPAGRVAVGVAEDAARRRQAERLVRLAPAADVVEARLDRVRVGRRQPERGVEDEVARRASARRVAVLEPAVAVGEAELGRRDDRLGAVGGEDPRRLEDARRRRTRARRRWPRPRRRPCPGSPARTRARSGRPAGSRSRRAPSGRRPRRCSASPSMREPSARTWMTRPRTPGVGDDDVAPPPEHEVRQARASARSGRAPAARRRCGRWRTGRPARRRASS